MTMHLEPEVLNVTCLLGPQVCSPTRPLEIVDSTTHIVCFRASFLNGYFAVYAGTCEDILGLSKYFPTDGVSMGMLRHCLHRLARGYFNGFDQAVLGGTKTL